MDRSLRNILVLYFSVMILFSGIIAGNGLVGNVIAGSAGNNAGNQPDWSEFHRGNNNTGSTTQVGPTNQVVKKWEFQIRDGYDVMASPIVYNNTVYVGGTDKRIYAVNARDGLEEWSYQVDSSIQTSAAAADGVVIVVADDIYGFDADNGTLLWRYQSGNGRPMSPTVANGVVYASVDDKLISLDIITGSKNWEHSLAGRTELWSGIGYNDSTVYLGDGDGIIYAIDTSGTEKWTFDSGSSGIRTAPAIKNGTVYVGTKANDSDNKGYVYALDETTGSVVWDYQTEGNAVQSSPAISEKLVVFGDRRNTGASITGSGATALYRTNGSVAWKIPNVWGVSSPSIAEGVVYVGGDNRSLSGGSAVRGLHLSNGSEIWTKTTKHEVSSSPAIYNNTIYVGSDGGTTDPGTLFAYTEGPRPIADFTTSPSNPTNKTTISFNASKSHSSYKWDFDNDGTYEKSGRNVSQSLPPSSNKVTLRVSTKNGLVNKTTKVISVINAKPNVSFETNVSRPVVSENVELNASVSDDTDGTIQSYEWDTNDNDTFDSTGLTTNVSFSAADSHVVRLRITGSDGNTNITSKSIKIYKRSPISKFGFSPPKPLVNESVDLDASESEDIDGSIQSYEWDLDDDGIYEKAGIIKFSTSFDQGTHNVSLRLTDDNNRTSVSSKNITIYNRSSIPKRFNWRQFGQDSGRSVNPSASGPKTAVGGRWSLSTGSDDATPAIANDTVVIGDGSSILATDTNTGNQRWRVSTGQNVEVSPVISNGSAYVVADAVYSVDMETGSKNWEYTSRSPDSAAPTIHNDTLYVSLEGRLTAIDTNGTKKWQVELDSNMQKWSGITYYDNSLYFGDGSGTIYKMNSSDGSVVWKFDSQTVLDNQFDAGQSRVRSVPAVHNGTVYVGTAGDGSGEGYLYALNESDGTERWRYQSNGNAIQSSPAVINGTVLFGDRTQSVGGTITGGSLKALNASTGDSLWEHSTEKTVLSSPAVADGVVYVGTGNNAGKGIMLAFEVDSGTKLWSVTTGSDFIASSPAVINSTLYYGGSVHSLESRNADTMMNKSHISLTQINNPSSVTSSLPSKTINGGTWDNIGLVFTGQTEDLTLEYQINESNPKSKLKDGVSYLHLSNSWSFGERNISQAVIRFRVQKSKLDTLGVSKTSLALHQYDSGWSKVSTELRGETESHYMYQAYPTSLSSFAIAPGSTSPQQPGGGGNSYINGTVKDNSGRSLDGVTIVVLNTQNGQPTGTAAPPTTTDTNGNYSVQVSSGTFWVIADDHPNHQFAIKSGKSVTTSSTTVTNFQLKEFPEKGYINGTYLDTDGNPVSSAPVNARDLGYQFRGSDTTDTSGEFNISVPAASYAVTGRTSSSSSDVASETLDNVTVQEGETTSITIQPPESGFISGMVKNASGLPQTKNTEVFAQGEGRTIFGKTNSNGKYNITAPAGEYIVTVFSQSGTASAERVTVSEGDTAQANFSIKNVSIVHTSAEVVNTSSSVNTNDVGIRVGINSEGLLQATVVNNSKTNDPSISGPGDLKSLGANGTTEFRINITVTNYSANALLWGIDDAQWKATENTTIANGTDITVRGSPVNIQATFSKAATGSGSNYGAVFSNNPSWASGRKDRADEGVNQTIFISISELSNLPDADQERLEGVSVTTNAQKFTIPKMMNQSLELWVAGPGTTVRGNDHIGFYEAEIPEAQLNEWGISDSEPASDLEAFYKGDSTNFTVTDTDDGARIRLENISYSGGFVEVKPAQSEKESDEDGSDRIADDDGSEDRERSDKDSELLTETDTSPDTVEQVQLEADSSSTNKPTVKFRRADTVNEITFQKRDVSGSITVSEFDTPPDEIETEITEDIADDSGTDRSDIRESKVNSDTNGGSTANVVSVVDISPNKKSTRTSDATVTMTVRKERISESGDVIIIHQSDDSWEELETKISDKSENTITFAATVDSFSLFAVIEQPEAADTSISTNTETARPETSQNTALPDTSTTTPVKPTETSKRTPTSEASSPGFGLIITVITLLALSALIRRRSN